jgi:prepilin-type N-terminal cleavage/methylation domain-containing protein
MQRRGGFTLLEVMLAMGIGVVLLGALYVTLDIYVRDTEVSKRLVEQSTLARSVFQRIDDDLGNAVALCDPARFRNQNQQSQSGQSGQAGQAGMTGQTGQAGQAGQTGQATGQTTDPSTDPNAQTSTVVLPLNVQGDGQTLNLFVSKLPREVWGDNPQIAGDNRRMSYWMVDGKGLARQEVGLATSDDALTNLPPGVDNEQQYVIAEEVRSVQFRYWDGTQWNDSWDGTTLGDDNITPIGPPNAIEVTLGFIDPKAGGSKDDADPPLKYYRHVIALPTSNNLTNPNSPSNPNSPNGMAQQSQGNSNQGGGTSP